MKRLFRAVEMLYPKGGILYRRRGRIVFGQLPDSVQRLQRTTVFGSRWTMVTKHKDQVRERRRIGEDVVMTGQDRRRFHLALDELQIRQLGQHLLGLRTEIVNPQGAKAAPTGEQEVGQLNGLVAARGVDRRAFHRLQEILGGEALHEYVFVQVRRGEHQVFNLQSLGRGLAFRLKLNMQLAQSTNGHVRAAAVRD